MAAFAPLYTLVMLIDIPATALIYGAIRLLLFIAPDITLAAFFGMLGL